jgi:putative RNA 2'-phosphotransferase
MSPSRVQQSKFLSLVLRHDPGRIGLAVDHEGWAAVDDLLARAGAHGINLTRADLETIVATSDKQRFAFNADHTRIRANQGHSIAVDLALTPLPPPAVLYHGTVERFLPSIRFQGLLKGQRHHVHLSSDRAAATAVGARRGQPVVLVVDTAAMHARGIQFFQSANGVWLTDHVPPEFLREET